MIDMKTVMIAGNSCLPFLHYITKTAGLRDEEINCNEVAKMAIDLAGGSPTITTVILATMGPAYFSGETFRGAPIKNFGIFQNDKFVPDQEAAFVDGYSDLVSRLLRVGKKIVFFIDVPEIGFDPALCAPRALSLVDKDGCALSRHDVDERQRRYRALVTEIARRNPALKIFDSLPAFCDHQSCRWISNGRSLYFDVHHLTAAGSLIALTAFLSSNLN